VLPEAIGQLNQLRELKLSFNKMKTLPTFIDRLTALQLLDLSGNGLSVLPEAIGQLTQLRELKLSHNELRALPAFLCQITALRSLDLNNAFRVDNQFIADLPHTLAKLEHLKELDLDDNPLNPALQSAYDAGLKELMAYLRSLEEAEPLYEAKLLLVGEGGVGKTTLLKALRGRKGYHPRKGEPTTHGVEIDIQGLHFPHPEKKDVDIRLNAWDFGGQEVYRVTHQFFFSRRSLYLLVWEPRRGVQQCQVEDWLKLIRLRVGTEARVMIVSTHCRTGKRIARINKPDFERDFGEMIVGFREVDSLVDNPKTGEKVGVPELKQLIAEQAAQLEQMGMAFNRDWKAARDELVDYPEPRISYQYFSKICGRHGLTSIDTETLAHLRHDLGYIVHYDDDERLRNDVVLQPQWLTKAIGFVLEDRATQEMDGILPDSRLHEVWRDHSFENEPRYQPEIYPFFLRLMEKYDVSYRLPDGKASLVAQHVPQVRPDNLPWLPENELPINQRRIAMVCTMDEDPPGLVPWMIIRTHDYAVDELCDDGNVHRLHWQKGVFLCHHPHGEALLEKRGREFHIYTQATYPEYFMNVLQHTLQKLITDNWPGLEDRYHFTVPCPGQKDGKSCPGRFYLNALRQFLAQGARVFPCQECLDLHSIAQLLLGFEERTVDQQLREIQEQLEGLDSRIANYFMAMMRAIADEAKHGPRLFTLRASDTKLTPKQLFSQPFELQLWCEAEGCQHPVMEKGRGIYEIDATREWVGNVAPYANFALGVLNTVVPAAAPAINTFFGPDTTKTWGVKDQLSLTKSLLGALPAEIKPEDRSSLRRDMLQEAERSGILALHSMLRELDPNHERLGLHRITTYTGDYRWLCKDHYEAWQPKIPDVIE
jgi:GTPase SAR1 family protein